MYWLNIENNELKCHSLFIFCCASKFSWAVLFTSLATIHQYNQLQWKNAANTALNHGIVGLCTSVSFISI